ncbi:cache domain-containing protein [Paenibacillus sp. P26]|nr:cache domain-containing protein [Paenibacillus sp. P26]
MWLKKSLFAKLLVGMLISAVVPLSLSIAISYSTTSRSVERQVIELNQNTMDSGMDNIKRYLDDLNHLSVSFYRDQTLMRYLASKEIVPFQTLYMTDQLTGIYNSRPEFRAVRYVSALTGEIVSKSDIGQVGLSIPRRPFLRCRKTRRRAGTPIKDMKRPPSAGYGCWPFISRSSTIRARMCWVCFLSMWAWMRSRS